ncbi:PKD domain-containing protein [Larkinella arboricola]|uniref:PKD domain-containing protein n=1 Tax=Larkinella arboricola TaxID=643671 RepID=A0A327WQT8_LARAB|nr:PKD domain-containing protein [Larkinella arboricola]RAJ93983.1 PKD domain-containing protein [Larkinella arboricola]
MNKLSPLINRVFFLITLVAFAVSCQPDITPRPIADFSVEQVSGSPGKIKVTNKSLNAKRYQWTFGDGRASTAETPEIEYKTDGTYTITLTAKSDVGEDQVSNSVEISGLVKIAKADFDFAFVNGSPNRMQFTNKSTNADRYQWLFGDGQSSTEANPLIEFKTNGVISAQLTARNGNSADVITKSVYISEIPTTGSVMFWTNGAGDGSDIEVYVSNAMQGLVNKYQSSGTPTTCGQDGYVTYRNIEGTYGYYARSKNRTWSGTVTIKNGECRTKLLPQ